MADFDPFASAGWVPTTTTSAGYSPVIDVGGSGGAGTTLDPNAAPGQPGSQLAPSQVSGNGEAGAPPTTIPGVTPQQEHRNFLDSMDNMLGAAPARGAPSAPAAAAPVAAAPAANTAAGFDPFAEAGFAPAPPAAAPAAPAAPAATPAPGGAPLLPAAQPSEPAPAPGTPEFAAQPWYQRLKQQMIQGEDLRSAMKQSAAHGATMGFDEVLIPALMALPQVLAGKSSFSDAYDAAVKEMRATRKKYEEENPTAGAITEIGGALGATPATGPAFAGARAATAGGRVLNFGRNVLAGTGIGALSGGGMTEGGMPARLEGARQGAEFGGALSVAAPAIGATVRRLGTAIMPSRSVPAIAAQALREQAGVAPGATPPVRETSPLPDMPIGSGAAFNNPGLAARERLLNSTDDAGAAALRTEQNAAIREAANSLPSGVPHTVLPSPPESSATVVEAFQRARGVLRTEEERLWTRPELTAVQPDVAAVISRVQRSISALPQRYQNAMTRNADIYGTLQDLYNLPATASLADLNHIRSEILSASRGLPFSERFAKTAADRAARSVLEAIESNPAIRTNPGTLVAYERARDFTRSIWNALDKPQFQAMLRATDGSRAGLDQGLLASRMFNFSRGTERTPQGVANVIDMLDSVRRQWGALGTAAGAPLAGLDPAVAVAARNELAQGTRDFIIGSMLDAASSNVRDQAGRQGVLLNRLSDWIDTNRGWISRSNLFHAPQMELLDRIRDASVMAARVENLRGGTNSATFERAYGNRYVDLFMGPLLSRTSGIAVGAGLGAMMAKLFGETGIGAEIGMELIGAGAAGVGVGGALAGPPLFRQLYDVPRAKLIDMLNQAIRDPVIAEDLMRKGGATLSPKTKAWARSLLAREPVEELARTGTQ